MADFTSDHVKNIVLLGHSGSGKTTMAEAMLFEAGVTHRRGSVEEKNTVADYTELEQERGNSIFSKLLHAPWRGYKINILDTPGYDDFAGEVISALRVADTGIILLNAGMGVEVGTDVIWEYTEQFKTPTLFVVNKLDHPQADFEKTISEAKAHFGNHVVLVQYPLNPGPGFHAIIDVLNMVLYEYKDGQPKPEKKAIPESERARAGELHKELIEAIAGNDEGLMEKYFDRGELSEDEMREGLRLSMSRHELFPVFCASALQARGVARVMSYIDNVCPAATEMPPQTTTAGEPLPCDASGPACLFVYKTVSEPHVGELSFFKVYSGSVKAGMDLVNASTSASEKITQLFVVEGNKRTPVNDLVAGDIGATLKLKNTHVNNTLHEKGKPLELEPIVFPDPLMSVAIANRKKGEEEKLASALHHLHEEDPTIRVEVSQELGQTLLHCMGDIAPGRGEVEAGASLSPRCGIQQAAHCLSRNHPPQCRCHLPPQKAERRRGTVWRSDHPHRAVVRRHAGAAGPQRAQPRGIPAALGRQAGLLQLHRGRRYRSAFPPFHHEGRHGKNAAGSAHGLFRARRARERV